MKEKFDLLVVGGGTAGALCAVTAARKGLRVAVVERQSSLGGMAANSGLTEMNAAGFQGSPLYSGIEKELFDRLIAMGRAEYHFAVPMSSNKNVKIDRLRFDPEMLKLELEAMAVKAGVQLFYDCTAVAAEENADGCTVTVQSPWKEFTLQADYLADGTGNAGLVKLLGGETYASEENARMVATLMFRISGVDQQALQDFIHSDRLRSLIVQGREQNILKGAILAFTPIPGTNDVSLNVTRAKCDHEDVLSMTAGVVEARAQIAPVFDFIKANIPALENAYISSIAPVMGVRDARRIKGRYTLTLQDLEDMTDFEDSIACGCYPMDIHDPVTNTIVWKVLPGVYHIPYRSILPQNLHRTLVVGKCLDADNKAFGAVRVMPIMMNLGESAGCAVAAAAQAGLPLDALETTALQAALEQHYRA